MNIERNENDALFTFVSADNIVVDLMSIGERTKMWHVRFDFADEEYMLCVSPTNPYHLAYGYNGCAKELDELQLRAADRLIEEFRRAHPGVA